MRLGLYETPQPYLFNIWSEPMRRFQLAAEGFGPRRSARPPAEPPETGDAPAADLVRPVRRRGCRLRLPGPCPDPAPDGHVLPLGKPWNAWLRQIKGHNYLYLPTKIWETQGFSEGDWARVSSRAGTIVVPVAHMAALNENTVLT